MTRSVAHAGTSLYDRRRATRDGSDSAWYMTGGVYETPNGMYEQCYIQSSEVAR
jgi:hypothetical protein